jgi:tRNA dimethylallyltransferase
MNYLITIIGPTAIGKTALSIALAQHYNCEILSCDSRQFYKEMKIGTAAPSEQELLLAKHHFIQNKSIFDTYTVGDFEKEAIETLNVLFKKTNVAIMVGGSGLYVDAVLYGLDDFPPTTALIRASVKNDYESQGLDYLKETLKKLDFDFYQKTALENPQTLENPQRMMRFVEVCLQTGKPYSSFLNKANTVRNFKPILIALEAERSEIYNRINQRVNNMINDGLLDEAQQLIKDKTLNALQTVGYKELFDHFEEKISLETAIEATKQHTRNFAKRQLTWFKRYNQAKWFYYKTNLNTIIDFLDTQLK